MVDEVRGSWADSRPDITCDFVLQIEGFCIENDVFAFKMMIFALNEMDTYRRLPLAVRRVLASVGAEFRGSDEAVELHELGRGEEGGHAEDARGGGERLEAVGWGLLVLLLGGR